MHPQLLANLRAQIKANGWGIQAVLGGANSPPFMYTAGLGAKLGYEVIVLNTSPRVALEVLIGPLVQFHLLEGKPVPKGNFNEYTELPIRCKMYEAGQMSNYIAPAEMIARKPLKVLQIVLADHNGKFPEDEGCEPFWVKFQTPQLLPIVPT